MHKQYDSLKPPYLSKARWPQGFIDQFGEFLTREEAHKIKYDGLEGKLFSEDLY